MALVCEQFVNSFVVNASKKWFIHWLNKPEDKLLFKIGYFGKKISLKTGQIFFHFFSSYSSTHFWGKEKRKKIFSSYDLHLQLLSMMLGSCPSSFVNWTNLDNNYHLSWLMKILSIKWHKINKKANLFTYPIISWFWMDTKRCANSFERLFMANNLP